VAMEACGGAHWWARQLQQLGHTVRLLPAKAVDRLCCATRRMQRMLALFGRRCSNPK
jgi:transposase